MDWLTIVNTMLSIVLTSLCGYLTWYMQKKVTLKSSTSEALKILLRKELRELYQEAHRRGYTTLDELEEYNELYEIYHNQLNGNGTGTKLFNDYQKLEVKEEG
mgnify:FL=1